MENVTYFISSGQPIFYGRLVRCEFDGHTIADLKDAVSKIIQNNGRHFSVVPIRLFRVK